MICLKPEVGPRNQRFLRKCCSAAHTWEFTVNCSKDTSTYKKELLEDILYTYTDAEEIRVYEDRLNQYVALSRCSTGGTC